MKKRSLALAVLACAFCLMGMGELGGGTDEIPEPDEYFAATITDKEMVAIRAEHLACDGQTMLKALRGKATISVPFSRIRAAEFTAGEDGYQDATITLQDNSVHRVRVKNIVKCTGMTEIGGMSIRTRDLHRVDFEYGAEAPATPEN